MFRTTHIRTKLAAALAIPLAALVAVSGIEVLDARTRVDDAKSQAALAEASIGPGSTVVNLQRERDRVYVELLGMTNQAHLVMSTNERARQLTNDSAQAFQADTAKRGGVVAAAFAPAWDAMGGLAQLRLDVDAHQAPASGADEAFADEVFQRYTDIIGALFEGTAQVALTVDDASLRNGAGLVDAATRQGETQTLILRSLLRARTTDEVDTPEVRQQVAGLFDRAQQIDGTIRTQATGPYGGIAGTTLAEPVVVDFTQQISSYLAGNDIEVAPLLVSLTADQASGYSGLRAKAAGILSSEASRIQRDALEREALIAGIALAALLLTLLVCSVASRSITKPLRSLKDQAEEMASTRLPLAVRKILDTPPGEDVDIPEVPPIRVKSRDEVAEVAAALSAVQSNAVDLAIEQAVLRRNISDSYINLGRRNQNLLSRQLDFITELERNETDPDTLEGLFRLDHIATRMRRNAESLLVLAGIDPPRQWSAPVRAVDVVRAALGEVEDYQRVVVAHLEPASVTGAVAAEIAHVVAELVENGLSFSPPDQSVEVNGRLTTAGYAITIADNGFGMTAEEIQRANRRLAGRESFTVAPSRYLGHYVAGHLASRLGIAVELRDGPAGGITATVTVPLGLVADDELDAKLAKAPAPESVSAPSTSGPAAAATASERTANGLPRRGERKAPVPTETPAPEAVPVPVAAFEPEPVAPAPAPLPVTAGTPPLPVAPLVEVPQSLGDLGSLAITQGPSLFTITADQARQDRASARDVEPPVPMHEARLHGNGNGNGNGSGGDHHIGNGQLNGSGVTLAPPSGLVRRVPGAQRPDAPLAARAATSTPEEPVRSSPEDVYSFLANFQSGVARGHADAAGGGPAEYQEDGQ